MYIHCVLLVVIDEFDKYNLIPRLFFFSCFKPPTVITEASEVITVGGLKHENNTLAIKWYLSTTPNTTRA